MQVPACPRITAALVTWAGLQALITRSASGLGVLPCLGVSPGLSAPAMAALFLLFLLGLTGWPHPPGQTQHPHSTPGCTTQLGGCRRGHRGTSHPPDGLPSATREHKDILAGTSTAKQPKGNTRAELSSPSPLHGHIPCPWGNIPCATANW